MKWNIFSWETMFKRIFRYLLKRYFGQYLEDFSQDDLTYGLNRGTGSIENVRLNVEALNDLSEEYNLPVEFLQGSIDSVSVTVPWRALLCENTVIELKGLRLVVQPKERPEDVSVFDSMWSSMTSSLQLAEECLNSKADDDEEIDLSDRSDGLEKIAKTIDAVLANMKIRFTDSSVKIEHVLENNCSGVALEIKIAGAEYFDEAGVNVPVSDNSSSAKCSADSCEAQSYSNKRVLFEGVSLYTSEFSPQIRSFPVAKQGLSSNCMDSSHFVPGSPEMPPTHSTFPVKKTEPTLQCDPILISKLTGCQELKFKIKQNEAVIGPKVDVEFNLGAFNLFLTPKQVHMLLELMYGLMKHSSNNDNTKKLPNSVASKPMKPADYALVEQELLRQQERSDVPSRSLKNHRGWSSHSLDESDEEFHLMTMENRGLSECAAIAVNDNDSMCSSVASDSRSDCTGNFPSTSQRASRHRGSNVQAMLQDPLSELTHFRGCCSSCLIIILHDDSVQESLGSSSSVTAKSNYFSLKERSETFFDQLSTLHMSGFDMKDFSSSRELLSELCKTNHLRLMASSISLDGNEKSSSAQRILNFTLTFYQFEVLECLFNSATLVNKPQSPTYVEILTFQNKVNSSDDLAEFKEVCFKLKYQQIECTSENRVIKPPSNKLDIQFGLMKCEVDISLTDRIRTLLNFQNFFDQTDCKNSEWKDSDVGVVTRISPVTEISASSPNLVIHLRFPVPDLRSVHDMERVPWWQQNLHKEILIMELQDVTLATVIDNDATSSKFEIQCRDFHGLLQSSDAEEAVSFLRVSVDPDVDEISRNNGFDWPRLVIHKVIKMASPDLESALEENEEMFSYSLSDVLMSNLDSEPSPFRSASIIHGQKIQEGKHGKEEKSSLSSDHYEVIKPAEKEVITNFIEQTINTSEYVFEFTLPTVNMNLPNKDFFELLYNRLGSDLLLWENASLAPANAYDPSGFRVHVPGLDFNAHVIKDSVFEQTPVFKPFSNDSNSDSEEEEATYCSVHEYYQRQKQKHRKKSSNQNFTKLSVSLAITKGMLTINTPVLDSCNEVMPSYCGQLQLRVEEGLIFIASSYKGEPNESYICLLTEKSNLYHDGAVLQESDLGVVQPYSSSIKSRLDCIIYESEKGMQMKFPSCEKNKDMLKVAIHVVHNTKQPIKTFKVAIEISGATLRHYMRPVNQMWINQFIDFLKVKDYNIYGYVPPSVVTELHFNLFNCAVDYRPLKLPLRSAITVENFNMSCNVTATTPSFLFRIISEEMRLFVSNTLVKNVDLRKNYVCVIDTGLIDISFRTTVDEKNIPKVEMRITNNKVHIRTCADSFKALMNLIIYISMNGGMEDNFQERDDDITMKSSSKSKNNDSGSENLHLLMAEAMKECSYNQNRDGNAFSKGTSNPSEFDLSNTDDEFCILEDDPGVGLMPKNGQPQIRMLTDDPIKIIENHFSVPPGKSDVLKAPKHFPDPLFLISVREMSLVWYLYGGSDFKIADDDKGRKHSAIHKNGTACRHENGVTFSDEKNVSFDTNNIAASFCKVTPLAKNFDMNAVHFAMERVTVDQSKDLPPDAWLYKGGPLRNHDVLIELQMSKVQFQREVYPVDNEYASRYILLVHDIEIRDRLAASAINKFLYQYSSRTMPRQSHANMIEVKAVYTRPDLKRSTEECSLRVSCKPLRLNVDQDTLMFLVNFFQDVLEISANDNPEGEPEVVVPDGLSTKQNFISSDQIRSYDQDTSSTIETFYRFFSFAPDVLIRIDYQGKRVLMEQGALRGLLLGLGQLNASEIRLKRLCYRHGLLGHQKVLAYALNEWQQDILKNQLPSLLGGIGPVHSFVQLSQGVKDLFYLPVIQYKKDGQIVRGLQRGASSFSTSSAMAILDLASRLVNAVKSAAEMGYDMVSPGPSVTCKYQRSQELCHRGSQPADIREGVTTAYNVVKEGLGDTARAIYRAASTEHEHKGVTGAVGGVLRQIPPSLFKPIILGSEATHYVLGGVRHQLMPDAHQEDIHKWRTKNS